MPQRVIVALPQTDFDVTEVVVPWHLLRSHGHDVVFATENGTGARCDPKLLTGVIFGQLGARPENVQRYHVLEHEPAFVNPIRYEQVVPAEYAALLLPGGHAKGMRTYLESTALQELVRQFMARGQRVASICHGGIVLARTQKDGRSVIAGRRLTALTKSMEMSAWLMTAWKLGDYYRTYPIWVEDEVRQALGPDGTFLRGPLVPSYDNPFVVEDGNLITARWPGDAQAFAETLLARLPA